MFTKNTKLSKEVKTILASKKANTVTLSLGALSLSMLLPVSVMAAPASFNSNGSNTNVYPQTPFNSKLPAIKTTHKSPFLKANMLNPFPVCNASEDHRTVVYKVTDNWMPVGTISTFNNTDRAIPLTQTTSKTQTISMSINGSRTETTSVSGGLGLSATGSGVTGNASISAAYSLAEQFGGSAAYSLSWSYGQQIGPYDVPAGYTGEATYGFRAVNMTGTQQFCKADGTWSTPTAWRAFVPVKNEIRLGLYKDLVDSIDTSVPTYDYSAPTPSVPTNVSVEPPTQQQPYDLQPYLTVSTAKAQGFAGATALRIKNVGTEDYYEEFPVVSFLVKVKTIDEDDVPKGVDRIIKPSWYNGAYVQDLGFDRAESTRSFLVTLSNQIDAGDEVLVASFNFYDGLTKRGRLKNYIEVSQIGRSSIDDTYYNDINVDSRTSALDDFGNPIEGIY